MTEATSPGSQRGLFGFDTQFWILTIGTLINSTGSALVFPFIALYIGRTFGVSEAEVGLVFTLYAAVSLLSGAAGGALTDRFGRKVVMIIGLLSAIAFSIILALATSLAVVLLAIVVIGLLSPVFGPAVNAMIADMLTEDQRPRGYGLIRVAANLGVVIGPLLGGLLADQPGGFLLLFTGDAATSGIFALMIAFFIRETKPEAKAQPEAAEDAAETSQSWRDALRLFDGYGKIIRDTPFVLFALTFLASTIVYSQMNTNLVLYLDAEFGISAGQYSLLISLNALMVVLMQFPITARIEHFDRMKVLAVGALCYGIGFGMFGFVGAIWWFALGMAILTVGEMVIVPVAQSVVADFAPEDMRGRYMGFYGLVWGLSFGIGPLMGGIVLSAGDGEYRRYIWYAALIIGVLGALAFVWLGRYLHQRTARIRWQEMLARYRPGGVTDAHATQEMLARSGTPVLPGAKTSG